MRAKHLAILGSTGSIGRAALDVVEHLGQSFEIVALTARTNSSVLAEQIRRFRPRLVAFGSTDEEIVVGACREVGATLIGGREGIVAAAIYSDADIILNSLVGAAGLVPTIRALEAGKRVALANKESLVIGGELVIGVAGNEMERLIPVDSEHASLHVSLKGRNQNEVRALWLTASGGALRDYEGEMSEVTPRQALAHPTWSMGAKITIDSATMMNKGLEIIEAHYLFGLPVSRINVLMHKQSIVHCLVELTDGSVLAHLARPDMRGPIQYALTYPDLCPTPQSPLLSGGLGTLSFSPVDEERHPCLSIARQAAEVGGTILAAMNAANEIAVESFLEERLRFIDIARVIENVLETHETVYHPSLEDILETDEMARKAANKVVAELGV